MRIAIPQLTEGRRAGILAAVGVYPVTRLAGTLPRPPLDRALLSGATMAAAYLAASSTTTIVRRAVVGSATTEEERDLRTGVATALLAAGAGLGAWAVRHRAAAASRSGQRLAIPLASAGTLAEVVAVSAASGAVISATDSLGARLPESLHPRTAGMTVAGAVVAGVLVAAAARHPRVLSYAALPAVPGLEPPDLRLEPGARLPVAVGRAAGVALLAVAGMTLEVHAAERLASVIDGTDSPGALAEVAGHVVMGACGVALALTGFAFYSSRVAVHERLLEAAYAAVPGRATVSGGPLSTYSFLDLGREGRRFVSQAHTAEELAAVLGVPSSDPVRAVVPLDALTGDPEEDAAQVVGELERLGGFAKGIVVLAAPTGDGYVSYVHTESLELLTAGDCATVTVHYANMPSLIAFPMRHKVSARYAVYARAIARRARELGSGARLFVFGESLGAIVAIDAFGADTVDALSEVGYAGGLYLGVPIFSVTDRALRPRDPSVRESRGLQYAGGRAQALDATAGHLNLTHPTDPLAVADPSILVRHPVDYWGRPTGVHVPLVSFLVALADVKNAMDLRPGHFVPSPGHDYRFETAAAVARAYGLPFEDEDLVERALRERELAWSVRRLLSRRLGEARDAAVEQLRTWGVDPATLTDRFSAQREALPAWLDALIPARDPRFDATPPSAA